MAAVEAGPISRTVWDFIWLRVVSVERGGKKKIGYQELPGVTSGYRNRIFDFEFRFLIGEVEGNVAEIGSCQQPQRARRVARENFKVCFA